MGACKALYLDALGGAEDDASAACGLGACGVPRWVSLNNLGLAHYSLGALDLARQLWGRASRLAPLEPVPLGNLLWLEVVENREEAAELTAAITEVGLRAEAAALASALLALDGLPVATPMGTAATVDGGVQSFALHGSASIAFERRGADGSIVAARVEAEPAWVTDEEQPGDDAPWADRRCPNLPWTARPETGTRGLSVSDVAFGRELCDFAGMNSTARRATGEERYVDVVKRWVTGFLAPPRLATREGGLAGGLEPSGKRNVFDVGYENVGAGGALAWDDKEKGAVLAFAHVGSLNLLHAALADVVARGVPGDVVECGVFRGGTAVLAAAVLEAYDAGSDRRVVAVDTFAGIPRNKHGDAHTDDWPENSYAASEDDVALHFYQIAASHRLRVLKGPFDEVLPTYARTSPPIALLRIDADTYEGTNDALRNLYDRLSPGGVVVVDDYHLGGCRRAVRDFRDARGISAPILPVPIDYVLGCPKLPLNKRYQLAEDVLLHTAQLRQATMLVGQNVYWVKPHPDS